MIVKKKSHFSAQYFFLISVKTLLLQVLTGTTKQLFDMGCVVNTSHPRRASWCNMGDVTLTQATSVIQTKTSSHFSCPIKPVVC